MAFTIPHCELGLEEHLGSNPLGSQLKLDRRAEVAGPTKVDLLLRQSNQGLMNGGGEQA